MITSVGLSIQQEPPIYQANDELPINTTLYPPDDLVFEVSQLPEREMPRLPIAQDIPKNIGGTGRALAFYDATAKLPNWDIIAPVWPIKINQYFTKYHTGVDLGCQYREPIYAVQDGIAAKVSYGWSGGYGNMVLLQHNGGFQTLYGHNDQIFIKQGQSVKQGQIIASCGNSGRSTGTHSHFSIILDSLWLNPLKYLNF